MCSGYRWFEKGCNCSNHLAQFHRCCYPSAPAQKSQPLDLLLRNGGERECQRKRKPGRNGCAATIEGRTQRIRENLTNEVLMLRERVDVEEVPHAAVGFAKDDHSVKLLGDGCLRTVGTETVRHGGNRTEIPDRQPRPRGDRLP